MSAIESFLDEHRLLTRRFLLRIGAGGILAAGAAPLLADEPPAPDLAEALSKLEPFFTAPDQFRDVSRGDPIPHTLSDEKKQAAGITRDSWRLEVVADPDNPAKLHRPMSRADGTALDFAGLMELAKTRSVRFAKVMTCLNIGCPLGMGVWEGVPLRDVIWQTRPADNLRRVVYHGYHNDDPKQMFKSSLPIGRVLEDPFDLPPVVLCYKLNGEWLTAARGGPVRIVVPEAYGFKSIKWLTTILLTNLSHSNDTYADGNNDVESPLKTFAATLSIPRETKANAPIPVTGYAQVGISGLSKVQVWIQRQDELWPQDDRYFQQAPWIDAKILAPPSKWGGGFEDALLKETTGFDNEGRPRTWPMKLGKAHWAALLPGLPAAKYVFRCRTIDEKRAAQPMPRPFRKSGHAAIEEVSIVVT